MRYQDFLRTAVLLFGASATVLAAVAVAGAHGKDESTLIYGAFGLWAIAALYGGWVGRRPTVARGIARMLASARSSPLLPELHPGTVLINRLWGLALFTVVAGGLAFVAPQVPAIGAAFPLIVGLHWRRQGAAVAAIEERDGVRFYVEQNSPFQPTRLVRTPGFRRNEPSPTDAQGVSVP